MTQHFRGRLTSLVWLAATIGGCGGWVDLKSSQSNGGSGSGSMPVGGTSALLGGAAGKGSATSATSDGGRGQSGARPDSPADVGAGGERASGAGGASPEPGHGPLLLLQPPTPTRFPDGAEGAGVTWVGTSSIDGGSLEDGVLVGSNAYCFKLTPSSPQCEWDSQEPFVWTEALGMVVLDGLEPLGADARYFYPRFVSLNADVVVGSFMRGGAAGRSWGGYFRWTKDGGATTLGEPADTESGGPEFMSDDGSVVAGMAKLTKTAAIEHVEFVWTVAGGFQRADASPSWPASAELKSLSSDGTMLIAQTQEVPKEALLFLPGSPVGHLGHLPDLPSCEVNRVSRELVNRDSPAVFGTCQDFPGPGSSFHWTKFDGMRPLLKAGSNEPCEMYPSGVSQDASIAFGSARCGASTTWSLARWSTEGVTLLPTPPLGRAELVGAAASSDGRVAFGVLLPATGAIEEEGRNGAQAFRYTVADGFVPLGMLAGHLLSSPYAADAHGDVLVGRSGIENGASEAVLWDEVGRVGIAGYLQSQGVDLHGAHLQSAERVATHDGVTVVQGVADLVDRTGAWIAWIPRRN